MAPLFKTMRPGGLIVTGGETFLFYNRPAVFIGSVDIISHGIKTSPGQVVFPPVEMKERFVVGRFLRIISSLVVRAKGVMDRNFPWFFRQ